MNIFFLDKTPEFSAEYLCDKHIPKMFLESAQMLSTAVQTHIGKVDYLYKSAYPNHPMTKWVGLNKGNFDWAFQNANCIGQEYFKRFNKIHKSSKILLNILSNNHKEDIPEGDFTEPPQCMPDEYRDKDYVTAYRRYYNTDKKYFAKWEKGRSCPEWWVQ